MAKACPSVSRERSRLIFLILLPVLLAHSTSNGKPDVSLPVSETVYKRTNRNPRPEGRWGELCRPRFPTRRLSPEPLLTLRKQRSLHTSSSTWSDKETGDAWDDMLHFDGWEDVDPSKYLSPSPDPSPNFSATRPASNRSQQTPNPAQLEAAFPGVSDPDSKSYPGQTWSEYMGTSQDEDSPWASLDAFADSPTVASPLPPQLSAGSGSPFTPAPATAQTFPTNESITAPQPGDGADTLAMKALVAQMVARQDSGPRPTISTSSTHPSPSRPSPSPPKPPTEHARLSPSNLSATSPQPGDSAETLALKAAVAQMVGKSKPEENASRTNDISTHSQPLNAGARSQLTNSSTSAASFTSATSLTGLNPNPAAGLTHVSPSGALHMVDVTSKPWTSRSATAQGRVWLPSQAVAAILAGESGGQDVLRKGPVLHTAQLAGIMGAKKVGDLIPLCHPLHLSQVDIDFSWDPAESEADNIEGSGQYLVIRCTARTNGPTGVEMEALTGVNVACLTVWDMVKAVAGREMVLDDIKVVAKSGGKSGDWVREN